MRDPVVLIAAHARPWKTPLALPRPLEALGAGRQGRARPASCVLAESSAVRAGFWDRPARWQAVLLVLG